MRTVYVVLCVTTLIMCTNIPGTSGEVFNIGTPVERSDTMCGVRNATYFDSGSWLIAHKDYIDDLPAILDGNASTGLANNYGPGHDSLGLYLFFPYPYHVDNITLKPSFGGGATSNRLRVYYGPEPFLFSDFQSNQVTFQINGRVNGILLEMLNGGTNQFNFNDIIINYTPMPATVNESLIAINILQNQVKVLQGQMDNITARVSLLEWYFADIEACLQTINQTINGLNITLGNLNQTLQSILENLTGIYYQVESMGLIMGQLSDEVADINASMEATFIDIETNLSSLEASIRATQSSIGNLETNTSVLPQVLRDIDNLMENVTILNQDLTKLADLIPYPYDDTAMEPRIFALEGENTALQAEVGNLTAQLADSDAQAGELLDEVETLNAELDAQGEIIDDLRSDMENYSQPGLGADSAQKETVVEKDPDNTLSMVAILIGVIGVALAIVGAMMVMSVKKRLGAMEEANIQNPEKMQQEQVGQHPPEISERTKTR